MLASLRLMRLLRVECNELEFGISHKIMPEFFFEKQTVTYPLDVVSFRKTFDCHRNTDSHRQ